MAAQQTTECNTGGSGHAHGQEGRGREGGKGSKLTMQGRQERQWQHIEPWSAVRRGHANRPWKVGGRRHGHGLRQRRQEVAGAGATS